MKEILKEKIQFIANKLHLSYQNTMYILTFVLGFILGIIL